ncbi:AAA family ATPase [Candidatus Poriferisodalis sp.]|uniref:AAA family ATPase n=1 Tax=Candidatus Poriferisodalis sp. TaxID=3101277 RepID=UPI003B02C9C2
MTTDGLHLPSMQIRGFRGIPRLDMKRLGRVTLLAGRNGVGKTTVLDAVRLYAERGSIVALHGILTRHEELETWPDDDDGWDERPVFEALFTGRRPELQSSFTVGPDSGESRVCATIVAPEDVSRDQLKLFESRSGPLDSPILQVKVGQYQQYLPVFDKIDRAYEPLFLHGRRSRHWVQEAEWPASVACVALGPGLPGNRQAAAHWDELAAGPREELALDALQLACDGTIVRIAAVAGSARSRERRIVVGLDDGDRVPLRSLGDGAARLFGLAIAFSNAADGFLLIDEAENGIHHSLQTDYWRLVFQASRDHNVQVIATTHSWDCVEGFALAASKDERSEGIAVRLERLDNGDLRAIEYSEDTLRVAAERGIEIR